MGSDRHSSVMPYYQKAVKPIFAENGLAQETRFLVMEFQNRKQKGLKNAKT